MKTAKSNIKDDLGKLIVELALDSVGNWAKREINYIRRMPNYPVCIQLNDKTWLIGPYNIKHIGTHRYRVSIEKAEVHTFYSKQAAMFYAILTKVQKYNTADGLLLEDRLVSKYYDDLTLYGSKLVNSKTADNFKYQLWQTKYFEAKAQYNAAKEELEKRLKSAKYMKIWEEIL